MIKVAFNMSGVLPYSGIERYGIELFNELKKSENEGFSFIMLRESPPGKFYHGLGDKIRKNIFDNFTVVNFIKKEKIDILHSIKDIGLPVKISECKYIMTLYDIIPLKFKEIYLKNILKRCFYEKRFKDNISRADLIIAISEWTKSDAVKYFKIPEDKIEVIYPGICDFFRKEHNSAVRNVLEKFNIRKPYILACGGDYRKNIDVTIKAFKKVKKSFENEYILVITGINNVKDVDIISCGYVSDYELKCLYSGADIFIYLSLYEGFGFPPLEAMSCGTPVIASDRTSLPEILDDCAIFVDPFNVDMISETIINILSDFKKRKELVLKGYQHIKKYNWKETARRTLLLYKKLVSVI